MCKVSNILTRTEYDAVRALLDIIAGYDMPFELVKESEILSTHFKYAYILTHWAGDVVDAFVDKLDQEQRYSLLLLNRMFIKLSG